MHSCTCWKPLSLLLLLQAAIGIAWSAEDPVGHAPADAQNPGQIFEHRSGKVNALNKARATAGKPGGPVEVFFKRLRVEPSFRATVTCKTFTWLNGSGGTVAAALLLVRDDGREMLVDASGISANELKLVEHLRLGQTYQFPQVCVAAGVPMNPKAQEPRAMDPPASMIANFPAPRFPGWSENLAGAEPPHIPHFLASTIRKLPPFRGIVMKKHSRKLPDGKVVVSVAFVRPDALPITISEVGAAPETARFVDFLKEGESYDFPAILDSVEGAKFPPAASVADSAGGAERRAAPSHPYPLFAPPPSTDFMRAQVPEGALPPLFTTGAPPFKPGTAEEKALDHYVGQWAAPVLESSSGKYQNAKLQPLRYWRRWTEDRQRIRNDGYYWHDLDASSAETDKLGHDVRVGLVAVYRYDPAASRFVSASVQSGVDGKLALKPANTGLWDETSHTFTWTPVESRTTTIRTSFSDDGVMRTAIVEKDSTGAALGEQVIRSQRERP